MNPEQQRIAIAEACGCVEIADYGNGLFCKRPRPSDGALSIYPVPDYLNDLNAMHEAEMSLTADQQNEVMLMLGRVTQGLAPDAYIHWSDIGGTDAVFATAAQRAEALLRTIGKWKERV